MSRPKAMSMVDQIFSTSAKAPPAASHAAATRPASPAPPMTPVVDPEALPPPKKTDPLPRPGDAYRASAQYMSRLGTGERMIDFVDRDCFSEAFSYSDLRRVSWRKSPGGPLLVLRFVAAAVFEIVIRGHNLEDIRHYIREGMMPWVWEQPANYRPKNDQMAVITAIEIKEVQE